MRVRAALGGFALAATAGWNLANVGAVAGRTADAYGVSLFVVGLFTTALVLTHAGMQIPAGRLCDRFGARTVGAAGLVIICLTSLAGLGLREAWYAIALRFLAGVGLAAAFVGGADYVRATLASPVAQGFYGAVSMAAGGLALALVPSGRAGVRRSRRRVSSPRSGSSSSRSHPPTTPGRSGSSPCGRSTAASYRSA